MDTRERDRLIRQLEIAAKRLDFLAVATIQTRLQSYERRQDRIAIRPDGMLVNESLMDRFVAPRP